MMKPLVVRALVLVALGGCAPAPEAPSSHRVAVPDGDRSLRTEAVESRPTALPPKRIATH